jgi:hypothetical protein
MLTADSGSGGGMPDPVFEPAVGPVNGSNKVFEVSADYRPGTTRVWRNGALQRQDLTDGWTELGGKKIEMNEAPVTGDIIQIFFVPIL